MQFGLRTSLGFNGLKGLKTGAHVDEDDEEAQNCGGDDFNLTLARGRSPSCSPPGAPGCSPP